VNDNGFIFLLMFGTALLTGILAVAPISAYRLGQRRQMRIQKQALAPDTGKVFEPELDLGDDTSFRDMKAGNISVQMRHAETAR
jgi:hypothetical protein